MDLVTFDRALNVAVFILLGTSLLRRLHAVYTRHKEAAAARAAAARASLTPPRLPRQPYRSFLCFDVEATCEGGSANFDYPNEIIEFPVVLLQWAEEDESEEGVQNTTGHSTSPSPAVAGSSTAPQSTSGTRSRPLVTVDTFHTYVRPTWKPKLTEFCVELTGIQQSTVDAAPTFCEMIVLLEKWLDSWGLRDGDRLVSTAMWVTDGPYDLRDFIPKQLHISPFNPPRYPEYLLAPYLNIKAGVNNVLDQLERGASDPPRPRLTTGRAAARDATMFGKKRFLNIPGQLQALGLSEFDGRQHSGIDDATNVARIVTALVERGAVIEPNSRLPRPKNAKRWDWMGQPGEVIWPSPSEMSRRVAAASRLEDKQAEGKQAEGKQAEGKQAEGKQAAEADQVADKQATEVGKLEGAGEELGVEESVAALAVNDTKVADASPADVEAAHQGDKAISSGVAIRAAV